MDLQTRHEFRKTILDIARAVDPTVDIDQETDHDDFEVLVNFNQTDYLGTLGMATTLIKAITLLPGVTPKTVDPREETAMQFEAPDDLYLSIVISSSGVDLYMGERYPKKA